MNKNGEILFGFSYIVENLDILDTHTIFTITNHLKLLTKSEILYLRLDLDWGYIMTEINTIPKTEIEDFILKLAFSETNAQYTSGVYLISYNRDSNTKTHRLSSWK